MSLCVYCHAIPYHALPSEDEDGLTHHTDLPALVRSSATCKLCELLLQAAYTTRSKIRQEAARWLKFERLPEGPELITELGPYCPGSQLFTSDDDASSRGRSEAKCTFVNNESIKPYLYGGWWSRPCAHTGTGTENLQLIGLGVRLGTSPRLENGEGNRSEQCYLRGTQLRVRALPGTPATTFIPGRARTVSSNSKLATRQMQSWLAECVSFHELCPVTITRLPSRVLHLKLTPHGWQIRLVESKGQFGKYAALSHCWGSVPLSTLTTHNLAERKRNVPIATLPATFRDAIELTQRLGLEYLWIDSLCIIQNDQSDWQSEAPRMSDVYGGAWITFSAAHADGCNTGLFGPMDREPPDVTPDNVSLGRLVQGNVGPFLVDSPNPLEHLILARCPLVYCTVYEYQGQRSELLISQDWMPASTRRSHMPYVSGGFGRPVDPVGKQHLLTRAWTLQERLLARRTLHFATDQIYWECNGCLSGEDGSQFDPMLYSMDMVIHGQRLSHSDCGHPTDGPGLSLTEGYAPFDQKSRGRWRGGWLKHIENYSGRKLTYESDKLDAVSGLAKQVATAVGDIYYAGLWKNHMIEDLCWRTYPVTEERMQVPQAHRYGRRLCTITAQSSYRAPSWSWACLNGDIRFMPVEYSRLVA
ncbi:hypothetical protein LTR56_014816 [Elasticomyces elasticus]|nr:hypothetical protein LTR56_014816 [Elasticomyces elasticus]KAK5755151.1 hypothetical protein LTS12_014715 [Elasticomyces elasticus]